MIFEFIRRHRRRSRRSKQQRKSTTTLIIWISVVTAGHVIAMTWLEGIGIGDAIWLTATTVTTVGYGDLSASTVAGRIATIVLIYVGGIFLVGKAAGDYFEYRADRRERMMTGNWSWRMENHLVVLNAPENGAKIYFRRMSEQLAESKWGENRAIVIVTEHWADGLPNELRSRGIVHVHGRCDEDEILDKANIKEAAAVVVLITDLDNDHADALVFDVVDRAKGASRPDTRIVAECLNDANRLRIKRAGACTVLRPMRAYPELMVRELVAPGSTELITTIFDNEGDECVRHDCRISSIPWHRIIDAAMKTGSGTVIGYAENMTGRVEMNPAPNEQPNIEALFVIVNENRKTESDMFRQEILEEIGKRFSKD